MHELAIKDALTGLRNKTAFDKEVVRIQEMIDSGNTKIGFAVVDLNYLKKINDTYGHDKGDIAITKLCRMVCRIFSHSPVFRIGGDEFAVFIIGEDYDNYDRLIADFYFRLDEMAKDESLEPWEKVSAAFGTAFYDEKKDADLDSLFKRADHIMYERKKYLLAGEITIMKKRIISVVMILILLFGCTAAVYAEENAGSGTDTGLNMSESVSGDGAEEEISGESEAGVIVEEEAGAIVEEGAEAQNVENAEEPEESAALLTGGYTGANNAKLKWTFSAADGLLSITGSGDMPDYDDDYAPWEEFMDEIKSIKVGSGITSIGKYAFNDCINLVSVDLKSSDITKIGSSAFSNCGSLKSISTLPSALKTIGSYAFAWSGLTGITIPNSVKTIDDYAFAYCNALKKISIPASVTSIGEGAFNCNEKLTSITVASGNKKYTSKDGVLFTKDKKTLIAFPCGKGGDYSVPSGVTTIGEYAFYETQYLDKVTLPESVTSIQYIAFYGSSLSSINLPDTLSCLDERAFEHCGNLKEISIPEKISEIQSYSFSYCSGLESVRIPVSMVSIATSAFKKCNEIRDVYYGGTIIQWNKFKSRFPKTAELHCDTKVSLSKAKVTLSKTSYVYSGSACKPSVKVSIDSVVLKKGTDYKVSYSDNTDVGTATVTVKGKGNCKGTVKTTFKIKPQPTTLSDVTAASKAFTAKWKKQAVQTTGYEIQYSKDKNFKSGNKKVIVSKKTTTSKKISGLEAKKTYYVRVRTYKTVNGANYYSAWSGKKSVKTK